MNILVFTALTWLGSLAAGFVGSLTGLGGGVIIVPLLVLVFGVDVHYAIGASLVSVIATSSGAAAAYVREGYSNLRVGMFLEIATTTGALGGAFLAMVVPAGAIAVVFGIVLLVSAYLASRPRPEQLLDDRSDKIATLLRMDSTCPTRDGPQRYHVQNVPAGCAVSLIAGVLSGLLGIGGGAFKVLAMDQAMRLPFKVSTTTSNFMIGVTAAASAGIYLSRGYIDPGIAMPVMLGVLVGSVLGTRVLVRIEPRILRIVFGVVILALAVQMIYKGLSGGI
ncbi:MAG TPA: sulfite exporter TauE/SafE family protein [Pirellulales bacterium]|nr:sulfite exporter TauE/SafE family protein [Pirellulales bacterium]